MDRDQYGDNYRAHLLEQYKLYVEMADRISQCHCSGSLGHDMSLSSDSVLLNGKRKCPHG